MCYVGLTTPIFTILVVLIQISVLKTQDQGDREQRERRRHEMADILGHLRFLLPARVFLGHLPLLDSLLQSLQSKLRDVFVFIDDLTDVRVLIK